MKLKGLAGFFPRNSKIFSIAAALFSAAFSAFAGVSFENPDVNPANQILFTVSHDYPGSISYSTAFCADAAGVKPVKIITCFPERMELLSAGGILQVRNRYGTARYSLADGSLVWVTKADSIPSESLRCEPQTASPDGKYICILRKNGAAGGILVLKNVSSLEEVVLDSHASFSYSRVPALWSPDSAFLVYEKNSNIYFCDPKAAFQKVQVSEDYRKIGSGTIRSVCWANKKNLFYLDHDLIYNISTTELYTRALYSPMVGAGRIRGRLPVAFNSSADSFYVDPLTKKIVVLQQDRVISVYTLYESGFSYVPTLYSGAVTDVGNVVTGSKVFWAADGTGTLWADYLTSSDGGKKSVVYRIGSSLKELASINDASIPSISPDGSKIAFNAGKSFYVYNASSWTKFAVLPGEQLVSYAWSAASTKIYAGGVSTVREWNLSDAAVKILFLSSAKKVFWKGANSVCAQSSVGDKFFYNYDSSKNSWSLSPELVRVPLSVVQNGKYRAFVGPTANPRYENSLFVRTLSGPVETRPLFPETAAKMPERKKVALIFDAIDNADGLSRILSTLKEFKVPGTFFVNGEFVRRYPQETKQIAAAGYECASMFFTSADLTGKGFIVDEEFIRRGLARAEDEFFQTTGKELSLYWHAPHYKATPEMKAAGQKSGYRYIESGRLCLDTITLEEAANGKPGYLSASDLVSFFAQTAADTSIIPISVGLSSGSRSDYLYEKLDLLIGTLLAEGFEIVPLREIK